ncbi:MAG: TlpA family protein disulfide reductase [Proteobacteria bacterium]|nr:MAG: TlpA family protein disulfide reductase [Pseudomonadota bacterium]
MSRLQLAVFMMAAIQFSAVQKAEAKLKVGDKFPAISLNYLGTKKPFDKRTTAGKVVLVDFWASDCVPCRDAIPELEALFKQSKNFLILGINVDENAKDASSFLESFKVSYPLLDDQKHQLIPVMGVDVMPTSFLLDKKGTIRFINRGFRSGDIEKIRKKLSELS